MDIPATRQDISVAGDIPHNFITRHCITVNRHITGDVELPAEVLIGLIK